jgi:hypothetical protein
MTVEIAGFNEDDAQISSAVAHAASIVCKAQGMSGSEAYVTGRNGADYAARLFLSALRRQEDVSFDTERLVADIEAVTRQSIDPH